MLRNERGVLKREIELGERISTIGCLHCVRESSNRSDRSKEWPKQSNKAKCVLRSNQINANFISPVDSGIPTQSSTKGPI